MTELSSFARSAAGTGLAAALLAACGSALNQTPVLAAHSDRGPSWMRADAKSKDLLYVVYPQLEISKTGYVDAYSFPGGVLEGQITDGLTSPFGDCTDPNGNLYVTNYASGADTIVEYAHGGTQPIRTLSAPGAGFSCAVDPTSGDLAVTTYGTTRGGGGSVLVYRHAKGAPRIYSDSNFSRSNFINYAYCGYDNAGDLFVDGKYAGGYESPIVAELPRGGSSLLTLHLSYEPGWLSGVQWDGKYLAVGQAVKPSILRFKLDGTKGTLVGSTPLSDATNAFQFVFAGKQVIVSNYYFYDRYEYEWDVLVYNYPKGGNSTEKISDEIPGPTLESVAISRHS